MRSDAIFNSLYLGWCLGFDWDVEIVLFLLLGNTYLMLGGDLVMGVDNCFILRMIFDVVWLPILQWINYHIGVHSFIEITSFSWFMMIDDDSVVYLCRDASGGVCWDDISSSGALLISLMVFMILGSICGVFLRYTSRLLLSWRQFSVQCIDLV